MSPEEVEAFMKKVEAAIKAAPTVATSAGGFETCEHYPKSKRASGCALLTERVCVIKGRCSFFSPKESEAEPPPLPFAESLRRARIMAGMTPAKLASEIGMARQNVSKWERGDTIPSPENMTKLSDILGVDVRKFL